MIFYCKSRGSRRVSKKRAYDYIEPANKLVGAVAHKVLINRYKLYFQKKS